MMTLSLFPLCNRLPWARVCSALLCVAGALTAVAPAAAQNRVKKFAIGDEARFRLEVVDAKAFGPSQLGFITGDPTSPVAASWKRTGAFADGASVLVIRLNPVFWAGGPVTFTITTPGTADFLGSLSATFPSLPAPDGAAAVPPPVIRGAGSPKLGFYRPPNNFLFWSASTVASPVQAPLNSAPVTITASGMPGGPASVTINLVRTPLVLVHGFNSNPGTWTDLVNQMRGSGIWPGVTYYTVDWSTQNSSGFDTITPFLVNVVNGVISGQATIGIAATRLDVFGHSAGNVMVKWWASDLGNVSLVRPAGWPTPLSWPGAIYPYKTPGNFGLGGIRRFVSVGGPFYGSAWADYIAATFTYNPQVVLAATAAGMTGDQCILYDLGMSSTATAALIAARPNISWCPIVGTANAKPITALVTSSGWVAWAAGGAGASVAGWLGFTNTNSDWIVLASSQIAVATGGSRPAGFVQRPVTNDTHDDETSDPTVWLYLEQGLNVYNSPFSGGYGPGYAWFNTGF